MGSLLKQALALLVGDESQTDLFKVPLSSNRPLKKFTERELISLESEIGGKLFGKVPRGHRREFFNLDPKTWIWYEEYKDDNGKKTSSTVRYEIHEKGIFKVQEGARYSYIDGQELEHFVLATKLYYEEVARNIYHIDPATGKKLV
jgi:hypothetical protein